MGFNPFLMIEWNSLSFKYLKIALCMIAIMELAALHGEVSMYIWFAVTPCVFTCCVDYIHWKLVCFSREKTYSAEVRFYGYNYFE